MSDAFAHATTTALQTGYTTRAGDLIAAAGFGGGGGGGGSSANDRLFKGEVALDDAQLQDIEQMRMNFPYVTIGETVIMDSLLSEPLAVQRSGKRVPIGELTIDRQRVIKYDMPEVSRGALSYIHAMGVVPLAVRHVDGQSGPVPYVPSYKLGRITTYVSENVQHFRWWWKKNVPGTNGKKNVLVKGGGGGDAVLPMLHTDTDAFGVGVGYVFDPMVIVLSGFDRAPNPDGTLQSKLAIMSEKVRATQRLNRFDETAARARSDPVTFFERRDPFGSGGGVNGTGGGSFGIDDRRNMYSDTDGTDEMTRQRIATNADQLKELQAFYKTGDNMYGAFLNRLNQSFTGGGGAGSKRKIRDEREILETLGVKRQRAIDKLVPLLPGATIASNVPVGQTSGQQLERDHATNMMILLTLGVPPDMVQTVSTHRAGVEIVSSSFRVTTLRRWQGWLERILTIAYLHAYGDEDETHIVRQMTLSKQKPSIELIDEVCRKNCMSIGFVIEERTTTEDLLLLLKLGFMTPPEFLEHFRRIKHMPASDDAATLDVREIERRVLLDTTPTSAKPTSGSLSTTA